jgi:hypothetical protein
LVCHARSIAQQTESQMTDRTARNQRQADGVSVVTQIEAQAIQCGHQTNSL